VASRLRRDIVIISFLSASVPTRADVTFAS